MSLKELKQYLRVDYTDDDSMIELMHDKVKIRWHIKRDIKS